MIRSRAAGAAHFVAAVLAAAAVVLPARPVAAEARDDRAFEKLGGEFVEHALAIRPALATRLGDHARDDALVPVTQPSLEADAAWHRAFRDRLAALPRASLSPDRALEYDLLAARTRRELLDLEVIRPFERDPNAYLEPIAGAIRPLLGRDFASPCRRMASVIRRLRVVPEVLRAARINLAHPPRIATEAAIEGFEGVLALYRDELGAAAARCRDPGTQANLSEADTLAVRAVEEFLAFLREDLLPRSDGAFSLGRDTYAGTLLDGGRDPAPPESLLARGRRELDATRARLEGVAGQVAPGGGARAALDLLTEDSPGPIVPRAEAGLDSIRAFLRDHAILTLPAQEKLRVRAAPGFRRNAALVEVELPGAWERSRATAYCDIAWPDSGQAGDGRVPASFDRFRLAMQSIHEVAPGRYYQALAERRLSSRLRQFLGADAGRAGWAYYCERMAIEQGFGHDDPRYEFVQLHRSLVSLGRLVASISLHTRGMTVDEATTLFEDDCLLAPAVAAFEARRAALDPSVVEGARDAWRILDAREDARARLGEGFRLREFHDQVLRQGAAAVPVLVEGTLKGH